MNYLLIDTSNQPLSVAVMQDDQVLSELNSNEKKNHSVQLMPAIIKVLQSAHADKKDLDAIVVAEGPGSYTGLRIGVTVAKTLAYALNIKLYGVSSLKALAATVSKTNQLIVPIFDARREAVYAGVYYYDDNQLHCAMNDQYITIEALLNHLHDLQQSYIFVGEDSEKLQDLLDAEFIANLPQAKTMYSLIDTVPNDVYTFKPNYLKISEAERNWLNQQNKN